MRQILTIGVLALAGLNACAGEHRSPESAGVNGGDKRGTLTIDGTPLVTIPPGATDDPDLLTRVKGATRLSDGTIVVADGYSGFEQSLKGFGDGGQLLWSAGHKGGGPGEFQALGFLGQCGKDSLFTWDGPQTRLSVFDARGRLAREGSLPGAPILQRIMACSRSGNFVIPTMSSPDEQSTEQFPRITGRITLVDSHGDSMWSLLGIYLGQNRVLAPTTSLALSDDRLYVGTGDSAYVDEYDLKGRHLTTFRVGDAPRAPTQLQYDHAIDELLDRMPGPTEARKQIKNRFLQVPMPPRLPPYSDLLVDPSGALWVINTIPGVDTTDVRTFDPDGRPLGSARLPVELRVFEVGNDYLLGTYDAEDGHQVVALYAYHWD